MPNAVDALNNLVKHLEQVIQKPQHKDAISAILGAPPRTTNVHSIRDLEVMQKFRRELSDGVIQVDTVHQILGLVGSLMKAVV